MCGIVGYAGEKDAVFILLSGLSKLEYRGYDSAGVAVISKMGEMNLSKKQGRLENLKTVLLCL